MDTSIARWKAAVIASSAAALLAPALGYSEGTGSANKNQSSTQAQAPATQPAAQQGSSAPANQSGKGADAASAQGKTASGGQSALPPGHPEINYLIIPVVAPENQSWKKKGCWAKFYDNQNFSGDNLTLVGPVDMPDMTGPFGINWKGKISSVETGPKARVLVYDNENYKDLVATFKPGQKAGEVSKKMGFFDEFSSLRIACDNLQAGGTQKSGGAQKAGDAQKSDGKQKSDGAQKSS